MTKVTIAEVSIDTQTLERELLKATIGDLIDYEHLSATIGRDITGKARHVLYSALYRVKRDRQMVFSPVRGVGMKRLDDIAIASSGDQSIARIRNTAKRGRHTLTCVQDFAALPEDVKRKHNIALSVLGVLGHITRTSTVKKIEARTGNTLHDSMPTAKFLEQLKDTL